MKQNGLLLYKLRMKQESCTYFFDESMGMFILTSALKEKMLFTSVLAMQRSTCMDLQLIIRTNQVDITKTVKRVESSMIYLAT